MFAERSHRLYFLSGEVMNTKEFLEKIWPSEGIYLLAVKTDKGFRHKGVSSIDEAVRYLSAYDTRPDWNTFHACAAYKAMPTKGHTRTSDNWLSAKAFWCDIDCGKDDGYATKQEAVDALLVWCDNRGMPNPMIIDSGHGIHAYWPLTEPVNPTDWVKAASGIKAAMKADDFRADPTRTADFASILRPVGLHNRKDVNDPLEVKLIQDAEPTDTMEFMSIVMNIVASSTEGFDSVAVPAYLSGENAEAVTEYPEVECSAMKIADKCRQMQVLRDTQGDVSYETWRGLVGLISFCKEGLPLAESWSSRRAETGHAQTDTKLRFNSWGSAPTTCEFLENCNGAMCENCPFKGKIKTPLVLGREMPEPQAETVEVHEESDTRKEKITVDVPELPQGYEWNNGVLVHWTTDKNGNLVPHPFCGTRFYLVARIRNSDGEFEYVARLHLPDGSLRTFRLEGAVIGQGGTKLMGALGSHEIMATNNPDATQHMGSYLRDLVRKIMSDKEVMPTYASFGWQDDGSFLIGTRLYKEDGTVGSALLSGYAEDNKDALGLPKGSLDKYVEALNWVYDRPGMEPMQYVICAMLASPLVKLYGASYKGIPVVITGASSGKGKTTACLSALYAFGDATKLTIAGDVGATMKARSALLGTMSDLPVLFDEVTNMRADVLSSLAYALSNGVEPLRLRATQGSVRFADRETWNLQAACTGNTYVGAKLAQNGQTEAEAMRLFEIRVDGYDIPILNPAEVSQRLDAMAKNSGCAGEAFIKWLVTHKAEFHSIAAEMLKLVGDDPMLVREPKYRFFRNQVVLTLTCAKILKQIGIIRFDIDRLAAFAKRAVRELCHMAEETNAVNYEAALKSFIRDHQLDIFQSDRLKLPRGSKPYEPRVKTYLVGRAIRATEQTKKEPYANRLLLSASEVRNWCVDNRVDVNAFANDLKDKGILLERNARLYLTVSTNLTSAQERCWVLDLNKIDQMNGDEE